MLVRKQREVLRANVNQVSLVVFRKTNIKKINLLEIAFGLFSFDLRAALRPAHMGPSPQKPHSDNVYGASVHLRREPYT